MALVHDTSSSCALQLYEVVSCEPNNQLNVCTTSVTEGEVARVKLA